jgi:uncharacterized membrane protein
MINLTAHALLFTIASIGISEAMYLIRTRIAAQKPVCPIGEDCSIVLSSKYNRIFGVHNDIVGMAFYVVFAVIIALVVLEIGPLSSILLVAKILLAGATIMSAIFFYLQWKVIKAWCFWCLMSAATIIIMDLIIIISKQL